MNGIVRDLDLSYPTVKWHIDLMIKQEFVSYKNIGNKNVYFPYGMIADRDIEKFTFLNKDKARVLYNLLLKKQGLTQKEICKLSKMSNRTVTSYLNDLTNHGFISVRKDGIFRRYYPTNLINELMSSYKDRMNNFRKEIKRKFALGLHSSMGLDLGSLRQDCRPENGGDFYIARNDSVVRRPTHVLPDFVVEAVAESIHLRIQVEIHLQTEPEIRRHLEILRQTQRSIRRDPPLLQHDLIDAARRHADIPGQTRLAQGQGLEKLV